MMPESFLPLSLSRYGEIVSAFQSRCYSTPLDTLLEKLGNPAYRLSQILRVVRVVTYRAAYRLSQNSASSASSGDTGFEKASNVVVVVPESCS